MAGPKPVIICDHLFDELITYQLADSKTDMGNAFVTNRPVTNDVNMDNYRLWHVLNFYVL